MLTNIHTTSEPVGLSMHLGKTRVMFNNHATPADIVVDGSTIEWVKSYVCLSRIITQNGDLTSEIQRRITPGWTALRKVDNFMRSKNTNVKIKGKRTHPTYMMTYQSET